MEFAVDGGCRGNGRRGSIGSAACVRYMPVYNSRGISRRHTFETRDLPRRPAPTNQRAELTAVIMALEWTFDRYNELPIGSRLDVTIYSDSRYAVRCMSEWIDRWENNGWTTCAGNLVANRDLIEYASDLDSYVREVGYVRYIWVPRSENVDADGYCNDALDMQQYS